MIKIWAFPSNERLLHIFGIGFWRLLFQSRLLACLIILRACGEPGELTYLLHNPASYKYHEMLGVLRKQNYIDIAHTIIFYLYLHINKIQHGHRRSHKPLLRPDTHPTNHPIVHRHQDRTSRCQHRAALLQAQRRRLATPPNLRRSPRDL
jgi:hypothetical protein